MTALTYARENINSIRPDEWDSLADSPSKTSEELDPLNKQIGGGHYRKGAIQPIEYIEANDLSFAEGCVVKYVTRHQDKGGVKDIDKAMHYLEFIKQRYQQEDAKERAYEKQMGIY